MKKFAIKPLAVALAATVSLAGCGDDRDTPGKASAPSAAASSGAGVTPGQAAAADPVSRWYGDARVARGAEVFAQNCAVCHGASAQGSFTWRQRGADGNFPPPPLNGTAHAWHHPIAALAAQIKSGAPAGQGTMPGFASMLSDEQVLDVIAWFQSKWPDEIYARWAQIEERSRSARQ